MFVVAAAGILVVMALALARALMGPTIFDRVLSVNMVGTNFIGTIAVLKYLKFGAPDAAGRQPRGAPE